MLECQLRRRLVPPSRSAGDAARVCADWLEEHGMNEWAEAVRTLLDHGSIYSTLIPPHGAAIDVSFSAEAGIVDGENVLNGFKFIPYWESPRE